MLLSSTIVSFIACNVTVQTETANFLSIDSDCDDSSEKLIRELEEQTGLFSRNGKNNKKRVVKNVDGGGLFLPAGTKTP